MNPKMKKFVFEPPPIEEYTREFDTKVVFISERGRNHAMWTEDDYLLILYEAKSRLVFWDADDRRRLCKSEDLENLKDDSYKLLKRIIKDLIYCPANPRYFGILSRDGGRSSVQIYTNLNKERDPTKYYVRNNRDLHEKVEYCHILDQPDKFLYADTHVNVIELVNPLIPAKDTITHITCCSVTGNLLLQIKAQIYYYQRVVFKTPTACDENMDFIQIKVINLPWEPRIIGICCNYISYMGQNRFSMFIAEEYNSYSSYEEYPSQHSKEMICHHLFDHSFIKSTPENPPTTKVATILRPKSPTFVSYRTPSDSRIRSGYGFRMVPCQNVDDQVTVVLVYVMRDEQLLLFAADKRRDRMRLYPISQFTQSQPRAYKDFTISIKEDIIHVLTETSVESYVANAHSYLNSETFDDFPPVTDVRYMYKISSISFLNITSVFATDHSILLIGGELQAGRTIYELNCTQFETLCVQIASRIDKLNKERERLEKIQYQRMTRKATSAVGASILNCNFINIKQELTKLINAGIDFVHLDIMDGNFVDDITFGPAYVNALIKEFPNITFEVHMMVKHPSKFIEPMSKAGVKRFIFHYEVTKDQPAGNSIGAIINTIRSISDMEISLALNPETPAKAAFSFLHLIDSVLIMTVPPGRGGQEFMADMLSKVKEIREKVDNFDIELDGGIGLKNIEMCGSAGANRVACGSSLINSRKRSVDIQTMRKALYNQE